MNRQESRDIIITGKFVCCDDNFSMKVHKYVKLTKLKQWISENKGYPMIDVYNIETGDPLHDNYIFLQNCTLMIIIK